MMSGLWSWRVVLAGICSLLWVSINTSFYLYGTCCVFLKETTEYVGSCCSSGGLVFQVRFLWVFSQVHEFSGSWRRLAALDTSHSLGLQKAALHCGQVTVTTSSALVSLSSGVTELWLALLGLPAFTALHAAHGAQGGRNGEKWRPENDLKKFPTFPISPPHCRSELPRMSLFLGVGGILTPACLRPGAQGLGREEWMEKLLTRTCFFWWHQVAVSETIFTLAASKLCWVENWSKQYWSIKWAV